MLSIIVDDKGSYDSEDYIFDSDINFNYNVETEWFDDPLVKEMILDIDKSVVLSPYCIESPVFGQIPPERLSGGVKALILMLKKPEWIINASACGDNCAKWILKIGEIQDFTVRLGYIMKFPEPFHICVANSGRIVETDKEFVLEYLEVADEGKGACNCS